MKVEFNFCSHKAPLLVSAKETICDAKHWLLGQKWGSKIIHLPSNEYQMSTPHARTCNFLWTSDLVTSNYIPLPHPVP